MDLNQVRTLKPWISRLECYPEDCYILCYYHKIYQIFYNFKCLTLLNLTEKIISKFPNMLINFILSNSTFNTSVQISTRNQGTVIHHIYIVRGQILQINKYNIHTKIAIE